MRGERDVEEARVGGGKRENERTKERKNKRQKTVEKKEGSAHKAHC